MPETGNFRKKHGQFTTIYGEKPCKIPTFREDFSKKSSKMTKKTVSTSGLKTSQLNFSLQNWCVLMSFSLFLYFFFSKNLQKDMSKIFRFLGGGNPGIYTKIEQNVCPKQG